MNIKISNLITDTYTVTVTDYYNTNIVNIDTTNNFITINDSTIFTSTQSLIPMMVDVVASEEINNIIVSN